MCRFLELWAKNDLTQSSLYIYAAQTNKKIKANEERKYKKAELKSTD